MKKTVIFLFCIYFSIYSTSANWYGNHAVSYTNAGTITNLSNGRHYCDTDGDNTGGGHATYGHRAPANNNSSTSLTPETSRYNMPISGSMRCLYWDASVPVVNSLTYTSGWTNVTNQTVTFSATDAGGAGLSRYVLQRNIATNSPIFNNWSGWTTVVDNSSISGNNLNSNYNFTASNGNAYRFRIRVWDDAGNASAWYNPGLDTMIDTTSPTIGDVTNAVPSNLLASSSYNYSISISDNSGSPIASVRYRRENTSDNSLSANITDSSSPWSFNWDIRNVDNYITAGGSRQYTYRLTRICDQAGNCWTGNQNYNHNVYADTTNITTESLISEELSSSSNAADGSQKNIRVQLEDQYGNAIIPASGIGRTVDFHVIGNNNLRLNQYENTGNDSAVFVETNTNNLPIGAGSSAQATALNSTDGIYDIPVFIYAPTNLADSQVPGSASITNIQYDINRTAAIVGGDNPQGQSITPFAAIPIYAAPVYSTNITGDLENYGFVEGVGQESSVQLSRDHSDTGIGSRKIYLEFGGPNESDFDLTASGADITTPTVVTESQDYATQYENNSGFIGIKALRTFITAFSALSGLENTFLATVIEYVLDGKTIVYPSDIVNKDSYYGSFTGGLTQVGVKITGTTTSDKAQELIVDQFSDDVRIIGKLTKSSFRQDIDRNVYNAIRYISSTDNGIERVSNLGGSTWNNTSGHGGQELYNDTVLYFKNPSGPVEVLGDTIEGTKTLVVENGDVYITGNIINNTSNDILGIIALEGNIYIDPGVTDVEAVLYTNKSIISYNGVELDGNTATATDLANQLYIYGSIFAENTIGGSRATPIECPYYINTGCTTAQEAQKYDFNYLRRYFIYDSDGDGIVEYSNGDDDPAHGGSRSNGGGLGSGFEQYPVVINYNPQVQQTPPPFFD